MPEREFQAGMAEVIQYGVIGDVDLFTQLEQAETLHSVTAMKPVLLVADGPFSTMATPWVTPWKP